MSEQLELYDVTIIGGGPAGMYTAFYSGMRDLKTKLIEAREELGGRILIYPEKMIWDVGGLTPTLGKDLIKQLSQQAMTFDPTIVLGQHITGLERQSDGTIILTSATGEQHWTKTVVMAIGYGILEMAKLEIEGADRYEVSNLHYTVLFRPGSEVHVSCWRVHHYPSIPSPGKSATLIIPISLSCSSRMSAALQANIAS